jgi:hypothetical protein
MKKVFNLLLLSVLGLTSTTQCLAQSDPEASKFLQKIIGEGQRVSEKQMLNSNAQAHAKDIKTQRTAQMQVVGQITIAISNIKAMKDFKDSDLRQKHLKMYDALLKTYNGDYEKLFALAKSAEETVETMEVYLKLKEEANDKVNALNDSVRMLDRAFGEAHGINVTDEQSTASKKFNDAMRSVGAYRRKIFIEHFKIEKAFAPMIDDINKNKGKKMAGFVAPLQKTCEEVLLALNKIGAYDGDAKMMKSVKDETEFYLAECKQNLPSIAKIMAKPKFDSNDEVDMFNKWNQNFVTKSNKLGAKYGEEEDRLWDKHIPVYKGQAKK